MSFEIQQLPHPVAAPAPEGEILGPKKAASRPSRTCLKRRAFIAAAIARARRAAEVASERSILPGKAWADLESDSRRVRELLPRWLALPRYRISQCLPIG
jgi:hypothetical protein